MGRHHFLRVVAAGSGLVSISFAAVLLAAALLVGCGTQNVSPASSNSTSKPASVQPDPSVPERLAATSAGEDDISAAAASDNDFSLAIFQTVRKNDENFVCSPYSLSTVLSMAMAGAKGTTQDEMKQVLRFTLPYDRLHPAVAALDESLADSGYFTSGNGLWAQTGRTIKQPFVDIAGHYYGAALHVYDMDHDYGGVCKIINQWASDKTDGRIKDLMDPADKPDTPLLMMLVNAVHFKADWAEPFWALATTPRPFVHFDGTTSDVPMMWNKTDYAYLKTADLQAVEVPYQGVRFSMVVLMPAQGGFEDFVARADGQSLADIIGRLHTGRVELQMPGFEITSKPGIKTALQSLGMTTAFSMDADFTAIADPPPGVPWLITDVVQEAFITVNERGTEAAAATGVTGAAGASTTEPPSVPITIDHPFVYLIRDSQTGAILFIGQVVDPTGPAG